MKLLVIRSVVGSILTPMFEVELLSPDVGCNLMRLVAGYFSSFVRG